MVMPALVALVASIIIFSRQLSEQRLDDQDEPTN